MRDQGKRRADIPFLTGKEPASRRERMAADLTPIGLRPFVRLRALLAGRVATTLLLAVGLGAQLGLLWMAAELLDLVVGVMELWVELARKHLELTL